MNRVGMFALATALLAGGLIIVSVLIAKNRRSEPVAQTKTLGVTHDDSFEIPKEWLTKYKLKERSGKTFDSESFAGKVHVVNFFFTSCPTACPLQTQKVQEIDRQFGPQGVHFLSISCDPEIDTPPVLQKYAKKYNADPDRWLFLTGDMLYTRRIASEVYRVPLERYLHVEKLIVVDKWGNVRGMFHWNKPEEVNELKELLTTLLPETEPPPEPPATIAPPPEDESSEDNASEDNASEDNTVEAEPTVEDQQTEESKAE